MKTLLAAAAVAAFAACGPAVAQDYNGSESMPSCYSGKWTPLPCKLTGAQSVPGAQDMGADPEYQDSATVEGYLPYGDYPAPTIGAPYVVTCKQSGTIEVRDAAGKTVAVVRCP